MSDFPQGVYEETLECLTLMKTQKKSSYNSNEPPYGVCYYVMFEGMLYLSEKPLGNV